MHANGIFIALDVALIFIVILLWLFLWRVDVYQSVALGVMDSWQFDCGLHCHVVYSIFDADPILTGLYRGVGFLYNLIGGSSALIAVSHAEWMRSGLLHMQLFVVLKRHRRALQLAIFRKLVASVPNVFLNLVRKLHDSVGPKWLPGNKQQGMVIEIHMLRPMGVSWCEIECSSLGCECKGTRPKKRNGKSRCSLKIT